MREKKRRSIVKAMSWRLSGTLFTTVMAYVITGKITMAASIGAVELVTKAALYYLHERVWDRIRFGRIPVSKDDYVI